MDAKADESHGAVEGQVERSVRPPREWVEYNPMTATYDTPDGTRVAAELVDNVQCLADVLHIAQIRAKQRAELPNAVGNAT